MTSPEELNSRLSTEATSIKVEPTPLALEQVRGSAARRRRKRRALVGSVGALTLLAGGLVAVNAADRGSDSDTIAIAGPDDGDEANEPDTTTIPSSSAASGEAGSESDGEAAPAAEAPATTLAAAPIDATGVEASAANAVEQSATSVAGPPATDGYTEWLVPWKDGFLGGQRSFEPQPLPTELPEEVAALFPQEVLDLFAGGLPPTIEEATAMLTDAGLLDVVAEIIAANPEASAAIYSAPSAPPTFDVVFTTDGEQWDAIDFSLPDDIGEVRQVASTGDRIAVLSQVYVAGPAQRFGSQRTGAIFMSSTTDLNTWEVTELSDDASPTNLPDVLIYSRHPQNLAVNDDGWVASAFSSIEIDLDAVSEIVPEIAVGIQSNGGFGYGFDQQGISISIEPNSYDENGLPIDVDPADRQQFDLSWADLGVDPANVPVEPNYSGALHTGSWGGPALNVDLDNAPVGLVGADDGFYGANDSLLYSPDGLTWTVLTPPVESFGVQNPLAIGTGVAVLLSTEDGSSFYRVDGANGQWERFEIDGVPDTLSNQFGNGGPIWMLAESEPPVPVEITVDVDGYTITQNENYPEASVLVVDADGNTVLDVAWDRRSDDAPTVLDYSVRGVDVIDPESGEVLLTIDEAVMNEAYRNAYPIEEQSFNPDIWLLATDDGENWVVDHIGTNPTGDFFGPGQAAINESTVLIASNEQWGRYDL